MYQRNYNYSTFNSPSPTTTTHHHTIQFNGNAIETMVTNAASSINSWIQLICSSHRSNPIIVGLDCEWKPNYYRGQFNKVATLQLCVANKCLIVQLFHMDLIPQALKNFLSDNSITFVGVGVGDDVAKLERDYGIRCRKWLDLEEICREYVGGFVGTRKLGLKGYAREILGIYMEKPRHISMSNWEIRVLSEEQVQYACIDAFVSYRLGSMVLVGNEV